MNPIIIFVCIIFGSTNSARILGVFPTPSPSHYILGNALLKGLAERGHDVTMISPYSEKNPPRNGSYRDIVLTGFVEMFEAKKQNASMFNKAGMNIFFLMPLMLSKMQERSLETLNHTNVQTLLKSKNEHFDVVIVQQFMNEAHKGLATHFGAPLIVFNAVGPNSAINPLVGNPAPPSYVPEMLLGYTTQMSFWQRFLNSAMSALTQLLNHCFIFPKQAEFLKQIFPNSPPLSDIIYNVSLVLLNSHVSTNYPVPKVPNMIEIGGFHINPPKKLPKDLQDYLDEAKDGLVYFSMGSNLKSSDFPEDKLKAILKVFSELKHRVLWKWETDDLPGKPSNLKLAKWLPQQDILAHKNVKLFITHGGMLSTTEAIYNGVPVLAIPIFADQKLNAKLIENAGFGVTLFYSELNEQSFRNGINQVLNNLEYRNNAKKRSNIFHDRLTSPMDTATYWVEYVIRHKGAPHLRVAALDLPWYQYFLLDVIGFVLVLNLFIIFFLRVIIKKGCARFFGKCKKNNVKIKNN